MKLSYFILASLSFWIPSYILYVLLIWKPRNLASLVSTLSYWKHCSLLKGMVLHTCMENAFEPGLQRRDHLKAPTQSQSDRKACCIAVGSLFNDKAFAQRQFRVLHRLAVLTPRNSARSIDRDGLSSVQISVLPGYLCFALPEIENPTAISRISPPNCLEQDLRFSANLLQVFPYYVS